MNDFNRIAKSIREHNRIHQKKEPNSFFISEYLDKAADLFDKMADGDIQIVRHGRWLKRMSTPDSVKCSVCGNSHERPATYCPNCGARMNLKEDKDNEKG